MYSNLRQRGESGYGLPSSSRENSGSNSNRESNNNSSSSSSTHSSRSTSPSVGGGLGGGEPSSSSSYYGGNTTMYTGSSGSTSSLSYHARTPDRTPLWGMLIVCLSFTFWIIMIFGVVGSKLLPEPTGNPLIDFIANDWYYSLLFPLTIVVTLVAVYLNWFALKFFRHSGGG